MHNAKIITLFYVLAFLCLYHSTFAPNLKKRIVSPLVIIALWFLALKILEEQYTGEGGF